MTYLAQLISLMFGIVCASAAQWFSYLLVGSGHGWIAPYYFSFFLFILYPSVFIRMTLIKDNNINIEYMLLISALILDFILLISIFNELVYFLTAISLNFAGISWLILWLGWQVTAFGNLVRKKRRINAEIYGDDLL